MIDIIIEYIMSNSLYEPILKEGGSSKRPIDFYIEEFELYKTHCKRSVRYMLYYFVIIERIRWVILVVRLCYTWFYGFSLWFHLVWLI